MLTKYQTIEKSEYVKLISDPARLKILRLLMAKPATLSQLAQALNTYPAKVRHHLVKLHDAQLVEPVTPPGVEGAKEKYYQAASNAVWVNFIIPPLYAGTNLILSAGSHDFGLENLFAAINQTDRSSQLISLPVGSLDGLIALRQGLCQVTGCHLYDPVTDDYNLSQVRLFFPEQNVKIVTLSTRQQGLMVAPGNPKNISGLQDLAREDITLVNRNPGSGTRIWLDQALKKEGIPAENIQGYTTAVNTHSWAAQMVLENKADVGLGLLAAAREFDLGFIPLFNERYDLVIAEQVFDHPLIETALDHLQTSAFRNSLQTLGGYNAAKTGAIVEIID